MAGLATIVMLCGLLAWPSDPPLGKPPGKGRAKEPGKPSATPTEVRDHILDRIRAEPNTELAKGLVDRRAFQVRHAKEASFPAGAERDALLKRFPVMSLADRLAHLASPGHQPPPGPPRFDAEALYRQERWTTFPFFGTPYGQAMAQIHRDKVERFVNSPGFGVARGTVGMHTIESHVAEDAKAAAYPPDDPKALPPKPIALDEATLGGIVFGANYDFIRPRTFGLVRDANEVVGFQAHGFRGVPSPFRHEYAGPDAMRAPALRLERLQLVSLLNHLGPRVYLTEQPPRMQDVDARRTRELDPFEMAALARLERGAELHFTRRGDAVRMVGAIRADRACLACHGVERGRLLGAMTYDMRLVAEKPPAASAAAAPRRE